MSHSEDFHQGLQLRAKEKVINEKNRGNRQAANESSVLCQFIYFFCLQ